MFRVALVLMGLTACVPKALIEEAKDRDGDGHAAWQLGGDDCDDSDATVRPGLDEVCGNGNDDDCDGTVDDDGIGSGTWYPDNDGDGFALDAPVTACTAPPRHIADLLAGIDCDDSERDVHPGHPEICANGDDDDCDGNVDDEGQGAPPWYPDADGDGFATNDPLVACAQPDGHMPTLGLVDCDDLDDEVFPGAEEVWYDGVDQDCGGDDDYDRDGDEFTAEGRIVGGTDCDDTRAGVNPDANEVCGNGLDDDCDDAVDDSGTGAGTWYPDLDQDGFATNDPVQACAQPLKHVATVGVEDCNDFDSTVKPSATEIWYDGVDQDCAGDDDYDRDGDGFQALGEITGGDDCEDALFAVNPDATEVCDNHLDDDCDTTANGCEWLGTHDAATAATSTLTQTNASRGPFGDRPVIVDVTGDGLPDVLAGGYTGSVWLFASPIGTSMSSGGSRAEIRTVTQNWRSAGVGDFNGDGALDVAIGRHEARDARIYYGPIVGYFDEDDADVLITDTVGGTRFGESVSALPDFDGDGHDELCVGAWSPAIGTPPAYYLFDGPYAATWTTGSRIGRLSGRYDFDGTGWLSMTSFVEPTGLRLLVASDGDENYTGTIASFSASTLVGDRAVLDSAVVLGVEAGAKEGFSFATGDFDGDGVTDLALGAPAAGSNLQGAVYVVRGPFSTGAPKFLSSAYVTVPGSEVNGQLGAHVEALDFDGDGHTDLAVGATTASDHVRIFYGPLSGGTYAQGDADVGFSGVDRRFGAGDVDDDGRDDLVFKDNSTVLVIVRGRGR